jgi:hypothetical protein
MPTVKGHMTTVKKRVNGLLKKVRVHVKAHHRKK